MRISIRHLFLFIVLFGSFQALSQNTFPGNGNVGIGTTSPNAAWFSDRYLEIKGNRPTLSLNSPSGGISTIQWIGQGSSQLHLNHYGGSLNGLALYSYTASKEILMIQGDGKIGVGISNPQFDLSTNNGGTVATTTLRLQNSYLDNAWYGIQLLGIDNGTNGHNLHFQGRTTNLGSFSDLMTLTNSGHLGIGNTNPKTSLSLGPLNQNAIHHHELFQIGNSQGAFMTVRDGTANALFGTSSGLAYIGTHTNTDFVIRTNNSEKIRITNSGNVGIGTTAPCSDCKLDVDGKIRSEEVTVEVVNAPDYVFEKDYDLRTLQETKAYIEENKHLPEIPAAKEMEANGVGLADMNMKLLKKIEELTLYQIELLERLEDQQKRTERLEATVQELKGK